ncbi:hypothetical protein [Paracoccus sp. (in: a-proteobacteria)]|uniref:hypothetical protein n=1 Tax=Paracoccus sp. TaxID=267 RepID=UPI002AFF76A0|nr:hypothetical protein [Paracoccus sp. (in: a-proteobacteria)]
MERSGKSHLTADQVDALRRRLRDLPPKPPTHRTAKQVVIELEADIRAALARGYTLADIARIYSELGEVSASTLQSYLRDLERQQAKGPARRRRPAASPPSGPVTGGPGHQPLKNADDPAL